MQSRRKNKHEKTLRPAGIRQLFLLSMQIHISRTVCMDLGEKERWELADRAARAGFIYFLIRDLAWPNRPVCFAQKGERLNNVVRPAAGGGCRSCAAR